MKRLYIPILAAIGLMAGALVTPSAHARESGYFIKTGNECVENELSPIWPPEASSTMCRFWVPARFLQQTNYAKLTITTACYRVMNQAVSIRIHWGAEPKDQSVRLEGIYALLPFSGVESWTSMREYISASTVSRTFTVPGIPAAYVDAWWPRYMGFYLYYVDGSLSDYYRPLPQSCIKSLEFYS